MCVHEAITSSISRRTLQDPHASPLVLIYRYNHMSIWNQGACIGLYFINRPEWVIADHACSAYSYVSMPLYDTLGPDAVQFIVNHAVVEVIFCVPQTLSIVGWICVPFREIN